MYCWLNLFKPAVDQSASEKLKAGQGAWHQFVLWGCVQNTQTRIQHSLSIFITWLVLNRCTTLISAHEICNILVAGYHSSYIREHFCSLGCGFGKAWSSCIKMSCLHWQLTSAIKGWTACTHVYRWVNMPVKKGTRCPHIYLSIYLFVYLKKVLTGLVRHIG